MEVETDRTSRHRPARRAPLGIRIGPIPAHVNGRGIEAITEIHRTLAGFEVDIKISGFGDLAGGAKPSIPCFMGAARVDVGAPH